MQTLPFRLIALSLSEILVETRNFKSDFLDSVFNFDGGKKIQRINLANKLAFLAHTKIELPRHLIS